MSENFGTVDFFEVHFEWCHCDPNMPSHGYFRCDSLEGSLLLIVIVSVAHGESVLRAVGCDEANTIRIKGEMRAEGLREILVSNEEDRCMGARDVKSLLEEKVLLLLNTIFRNN